MKEYNWDKIIRDIQELTDNDIKDFNAVTTYCLLRRYDLTLPYNFKTCIKRYKKKLGVDFIEQKEVLIDIFLELPEDQKVDVLNHMLYYLHKRKVDKFKLTKLEDYLDSL